MNASARTSQTPEQPTPRWNPWPYAIIAFFAIAICGCAVFVIFCNLHPAELVARNYYEQEVLYQDRIDNIKRARELPATASISYDSSRQEIVVVLPVAAGGALPSGKVELYRPSDAKQDRSLKLAVDKAGRQTIDARTLQPGLWKVRLSWASGMQEYYCDQNLVLGKA